MSDFMVNLMAEPHIHGVDGWYPYRHSLVKAAHDRIDAVELAPDVALMWADGFDILPEGMPTDDEIAQAVKDHAKGFVTRFLSGDYYNEGMATGITLRGYKYVAVGGLSEGDAPAEDFDEVCLMGVLGIFDAPFTLGAIA